MIWLLSEIQCELYDCSLYEEYKRTLNKYLVCSTFRRQLSFVMCRRVELENEILKKLASGDNIEPEIKKVIEKEGMRGLRRITLKKAWEDLKRICKKIGGEWS